MTRFICRLFSGILLATGWANANIITNPSGLNNNINANALTMEQEVGNISLAAFNVLPLKYTFTFEATDGYPAPDLPSPQSRVDRVELTEPVSGLDLRADFSSGTGFRLTSGFRPTGGTNDLVLQQNSTLTVLFTNGVQGVAFTANRILVTNLTVQLYSDRNLTTQIGSDFILDVNTGSGLSERSFFGYYDGSATIEGMRVIGTGAQQYSVDDFSVAVIPEPGVLTQLVLAVVLLTGANRWRLSRSGSE